MLIEPKSNNNYKLGSSSNKYDVVKKNSNNSLETNFELALLYIKIWCSREKVRDIIF